MVTITNEAGTFQADTEKEALKVARQALRGRRAAELRQSTDYKQAFLRACQSGYNILQRKCKGSPVPGGWSVHRPGELGSITVTQETNSFGVISDRARYRGEYGTAELSHYGYRVNYWVENGAGFPMAICLRDNSEQGNVYLFAVGIENDQLALADLDGVDITYFEPESTVA